MRLPDRAAEQQAEGDRRRGGSAPARASYQTMTPITTRLTKPQEHAPSPGTGRRGRPGCARPRCGPSSPRTGDRHARRSNAATTQALASWSTTSDARRRRPGWRTPAQRGPAGGLASRPIGRVVGHPVRTRGRARLRPSSTAGGPAARIGRRAARPSAAVVELDGRRRCALSAPARDGPSSASVSAMTPSRWSATTCGRPSTHSVDPVGQLQAGVACAGPGRRARARARRPRPAARASAPCR